jgi:hypothetical protein
MNPLDLLAAGCLTFITVSAVYPPLRTVGNNAMLCLAALLVWFFLVLLRTPSFFLRPTLYRLAVYAFAFYVAFVPYLFANDVIGNRYLSLLLLTCGFVVYEYYEATERLRILSWVLGVGGAFALVTGIRTMMGLMANPYLSRTIQSSGEYSTALMEQGIGGYEIVYFAALVGVIAAHALLSLPTLKGRILAGTIYLVSLLLVILANYLTALLVLVLGSVLVIGLIAVSNGRGFFVAAALSLGIAVVLLLGSELVTFAVHGIAQVSPTGRTSSLLSGMTGSISSGLQREFLLDRAPVMLESVAGALNHPILGLSATKITTAGGYITGFGQHSHILDTFALFGLVVGAANMYVLLWPFSGRLKNRRLIGLTIPVLFSYTVILVFNNATPSLAVAACLVFPLAFRVGMSTAKPAAAERLADRQGRRSTRSGRG